MKLLLLLLITSATYGQKTIVRTYEVYNNGNHKRSRLTKVDTIEATLDTLQTRIVAFKDSTSRVMLGYSVRSKSPGFGEFPFTYEHLYYLDDKKQRFTDDYVIITAPKN